MRLPGWGVFLLPGDGVVYEKGWFVLMVTGCGVEKGIIIQRYLWV